MPLKFKPVYKINSKIARALMRIEAVKETIKELPITPKLLKSLRETARLCSTHYSTYIEGNKLDQKDVEELIKKNKEFPNKKRDEKEIKGYYEALKELERITKVKEKISEKTIKTIHAIIMSGGGKKHPKPTPYRDAQNVIKDSSTRKIIYMPPEAKDVPLLMKALVKWINDSKEQEIPCPIIAGMFHYQFATIHPYYDGNGRCARIIATLILHLEGYDLKGIYSLDEYYAKNLEAYYQAISIGPGHNYYEGREKSDITSWLEYFCEGVAEAFEKVKAKALEMNRNGAKDKSNILKELEARQRKALILFEEHENITSKDIEKLFNFKPRTARQLCQNWVNMGFLMIVDPSKKNRKYQLTKYYKELINGS